MTDFFGQVRYSLGGIFNEYINTKENVLEINYEIPKSYTDKYIRVQHSGKVNILKNERFIIFLTESIYNVPELKAKLLESGVYAEEFSEIFLNLFILERENIVKHLRGMFTLLIWDKEEKSLFIARDPFGIKPFYYKETDGILTFATKQSDLCCPGPETLSIKSLQDYLTFQYVPVEGLMKGTQKLKPGHYLIKTFGKKLRTYEYCHLNFQPNKNRTLDGTIKQTRKTLEESIYAHMKGTQSIGAYLSGGVDSTSLVALAKQYKSNIQTFTVGFKRQGYNECDVAKDTAKELGVENIQKIITPEEVIQELPKIIWYMGEPIADPAAIPNYFLVREAKKHVDVVLSGEGADELFGGYNIYRESESLKVFNYIPRPLKCIINRISLILPESIKGKSFLWRGTTPLSQRYVGNAYIFNENMKKDLLKHYDANQQFTEITKRLFQNIRNLDEPTQMQYIDIHTWLSGDILPVADRMTSSHSLELRVPFLDLKLFDIARTIPTSMKITHGTTYILRQAMQDLIPSSVKDRRKLGFPVPIRHWLKEELYEWAKYTIDNSPTDEIFYKHQIKKLLEKHVQNKHDYSRELWTILTFMVWYQLYMQPF
ncbi:asparagine synthase (glutamine-hydrolyzing) [Gracilibacillus alcaliphilus]|uniref:asparagine synthase (glutamine-hydrolyzing) n=1 Tax=Gracilibacillus alcaliphilus TaxID=1401441 RepID=UPI001956DC95|nr:asparagine synthase (glutamine-hydrolyzing) [Gracilibacillus alcaliphilus]MBM7678297.1 asparagine synthase (glutamine-hydrolyzing) [Gracilibacillus alcaliphilus]